MVETIERIGDLLGQVWALFEHESGELTLLALLLLSALALGTAYRCAMATLPARREALSSVVAAGSAITAIFAAVGLFFLIRAASVLLG